MRACHNTTTSSNAYIIDELKKYMLDNNAVHIFSQNQLKIETINNTNNNKLSPNNRFKETNKQAFNPHSFNSLNKSTNMFIPPAASDTLCWCLYVMKHDRHSYEMLPHKNVIGEKKIKIEYIELMRKNKTILKTYKFSTLTNMENVLANERNLDISTFFSLCVLENLNVLFIKNKTYFELLMNDEKEVFVVHYLNNKYCFEVSDIQESTKLKEPLIKLDNVQKPLKPIASYKVDELTSMCDKLGLSIVNAETKKSKNKKDLYDTLFKYF
jgi:hypothetical protein